MRNNSWKCDLCGCITDARAKDVHLAGKIHQGKVAKQEATPGFIGWGPSSMLISSPDMPVPRNTALVSHALAWISVVPGSRPGFEAVKISIPFNMVGSFVGRHGLNLEQIRRKSKARIIMATQVHEVAGVPSQICTIVGMQKWVDKALRLICGDLQRKWEWGVKWEVPSEFGSSEWDEGLGDGPEEIGESNSNAADERGEEEHTEDLSSAPTMMCDPENDTITYQVPSNISGLGYTNLVWDEGTNCYRYSQSRMEAAHSTIQSCSFSIPQGLLNLIISRDCTKIDEIYRVSGARLTVARARHDANANSEREVTVVGTSVQNDLAFVLIRRELEKEKKRRAEAGGSSDSGGPRSVGAGR